MMKLNNCDETLTKYAPLLQLSSRDNKTTQTGKEWANQRQPYFLLMAVLGADKESISLGCSF